MLVILYDLTTGGHRTDRDFGLVEFPHGRASRSAAAVHRSSSGGPCCRIAARCTFDLDELAYQYPEERTMPGLTPQRALASLAGAVIQVSTSSGVVWMTGIAFGCMAPTSTLASVVRNP